MSPPPPPPPQEGTLTSILKGNYDPAQSADSQFFAADEAREASEYQSESADAGAAGGAGGDGDDQGENDEQDPHAAGPEDDYDDPDGALWSGPAARSVPTSVSGFRMRARSRGELDRLSREYERAAYDAEDAAAGEDDDGDDARSRRSRKSSRRRRRRSSMRSSTSRSRVAADSESEAGESVRSRSNTRRRRRSDASDASAATEVGFFEGLSNVFRGRGRRTSAGSPSRSRPTSLFSRRDSGGRDSDAVSLTSERTEEYGDDDDPYGPYGSTSESEGSSHSSSSSNDHPNRSGGGGFPGLPGGAGDFFGESRIDFAEDGGDDDEMSSLSESSEEGDEPGGPMCHQLVYIVDEDLPLRFVGLHLARWWLALWYLGCVATAGGLWLLGRWLPNLWRKATGEMEIFAESDYVVVETHHHATQILPLRTLKLPLPVPVSTLFPPSVRLPPAHREDASTAANNTPDSGSVLNENGAAATATAPGMLPNPLKVVKPKAKAGPTVEELKFVDYRYYRFLLHPDGMFRMIRDWKDPNWTSIAALRQGLTTDGDVPLRTTLFDRNAIEIEAKSIGALLMDEVLHPFYIFQIFSIALWSVDDYYYYAFAIAVISVVSIISTLLETRANVQRMREMSRFSCPVRVMRDGDWTVDDSSALVPGDLIDLAYEDLHTFPADVVLLSGDAIVNESMLTGESVPVSKVPIEPAVVGLVSAPGGEIKADLSKHVLYNGTKIIRIRKTVPPGSGKGGELEAVAMVLRTGFNTTKGALVRSMLFPKPFGFAFYRDSFRFIGVLALVAVLGFCASSVNFVRLGIAWSTIVIRALDLITIVVPPALPATMAIGTSFAIQRLRKAGIFCISPTRVNIGGKINIVCFDKTGTLTEEGLDVLGVRSVVRSSNMFTELHRDPDDVPIFGAADAKTPLLHALATCHALKVVDGEVIGDPLDLRMFEFTGWTLEEGKEGVGRQRSGGSAPTPSKVPERAQTLVQTVVRPPGGESFKLEDALKAGKKHAHFLELGVLRTFDFVSSLRRMSVLVKKLKSTSVEVYVKGAPEVMTDICDKSTLPTDYDEILADYTRRGFRVIALAGKSMAGLTWIKAQRLKRDAVESDLRFLGLVIFENKLKPGTAPAIATFRSAHIPTRMVTGDNVRTAISVARECGMVPSHDKVYLPSFAKGGPSLPRSQIEWTDVDDETATLDPYSLKPVFEHDDRSVYSAYERDPHEYHLAVTGDVFRWMMDFGALETLQRMLIKGVIFARMSPDEKHELVERLQSLGYTVGFCGDGANDCGALKAADVGLSLSEAEASVAAPFTSRQPDIRCFLEVIKEGRASLVTSFSCFKFMALYSLIQFTTVSLLYSIASTLGDFQFLYIDLFLILPIAVTMGRTEPFPRIHPKRPTANLISKKVLTSLVGQIVITSAFQFFIFFFVRSQSWYKSPTIDPDALDIESSENTSLFLISSFQYILVAAVFCVGPPYRKPLYSNRWLIAALAGLTAFSVYTLFMPASSPVFSLLQFVELPHDFHLELLLTLLANVAASWIYEDVGAQRLARWIGDVQRRYRRMRGRRKESGKAYKAISRAMDD